MTHAVPMPVDPSLPVVCDCGYVVPTQATWVAWDMAVDKHMTAEIPHPIRVGPRSFDVPDDYVKDLGDGTTLEVCTLHGLTRFRVRNTGSGRSRECHLCAREQGRWDRWKRRHGE